MLIQALKLSFSVSMHFACSSLAMSLGIHRRRRRFPQSAWRNYSSYVQNMETV